MSIKMSELVKLTDTSKSTILFYIKEGLLPEPKKPKPNLHLYDEQSVDMIKFIRYLQTHFNASISEIKAITNGGKLQLEKGFESLIEVLDLIMGSAHQHSYSIEYICEHYDISKEQIGKYIEQGLLFQRDALFCAKELEIVEILVQIRDLDIGDEVLKAYVKHSKELASIEVLFAKEALLKSKSSSEVIKTLFDTTLILKPYVFNMQTLQAYQKSEE